MRTSLVALVACVTALAFDRVADAQTPGLPRDQGLEGPRRLLLDQAQRASDAGDHAGALDLAQRAGELRMSASLRRFIAEERAALGAVGPAYTDARECVYEAGQEPASPNRDRVLEGCRTLVASLESRIGRIVVRFASTPPEGTRVRIAGHDLPRAFWGLGYVVTPGRVRIEADTPGAPPFAREADVVAHGQTRVDVAFERDDIAPGAPLPAPRSVPDAARVVGPVVFAVGAVVALGGVAAGIASDGLYGALRDRCVPGPCEATDATARADTIRTLDPIATWTMIGGGTVAAAGAIVWVVSAAHSRPAHRASPSVVVAPTIGAITVRATF